MHSSRRSFLINSGLALAGSALLANDLFAFSKKRPVLALQLYTVRDDMNKDARGSLERLARMGWRNVEHAGYWDRKFYKYSATEFKSILTGLGLNMHSGHTSLDKEHWDVGKKDFTDKWKLTVEDAATAGQQYVITPSMEESCRKDYDTLLRWLEVMNKCGELCRKHGMKFGYHNHNFEFNTTLNGQRLYDIILQHTDPSLVANQMDMGNMYGAGGRALDLLKQYPGRYELMHVKDEIKGSDGMNGYESTIVGEGVVGTHAVVEAGMRTGGTVQFIVEQESYQGKPPFDCAEKDLAVMKKWGF